MIANVNLTDTFSTWFTKTNQVILFANQLNDTQNLEFTTVNACYNMANTNYVTTNSAFGTVNAAWNMLNVAYTTGNANYAVSNAAFDKLNSAFTVLNAAYDMANSNYVVTNSAFGVVNSSYTSGNANYVLTNSVFTQSNTDNVRLSSAYVSINANWTVTNSAFGVVNAAFTQSNTDNVRLTGAYVMANANYVVTNSAFGVVNSAFTQSNTDNVRLSGAYVSLNAAYVLTNSAFTVTNSNFGLTNLTYTAVNSAFGVINAAYTSSNSGFALTNATYTAVNSAFGVINASYTSSNSGFTVANAAFGYANSANAWANVTFVKLAPPANTPAIVQTISSDIYITGNLTVAGVTTQQGVQSLSVGSGSIVMYSNLASNLPPSSTSNAAIIVNRGSRANAQLFWNEPGTAWMFNGNSTSMLFIASNTDIANATAYCNSSFYTISNGSAAFGAANQAGVVANNVYAKANGVVQTAYVTHSVGGTSLTPTTNANTITITSSNNIVLIANATNSGIQITQNPSGVTAQSYGGLSQIPTFVIDQFGRITSASNVAATNSFATIIASGNTFFANSINTSLTIGNSNGIVVTSNATNNFINLGVQANSGIVANVNGVFLATGGAGAGQQGSSGIASVTLDAFGRVTAVATATYLTSAVTSVTGTSGQIFVTNGTSNPTLNLVNSGVTSGTYTANDNFVPTFVVDQYGRITSASNVAVGNANYAIALTTAANTWTNATFLKLAGGTITGNVTISGNLTVTGNTTYVNTQTLLVGTNNIIHNAELPSTSPPLSVNSGMVIARGTYPNTSIFWNETTGFWSFTDNNSTQVIATYANAQAAFAKANGVSVGANGYTDQANTYLQGIIGSASYYTLANGVAAFGAANTAGVVANNVNTFIQGSYVTSTSLTSTLGSYLTTSSAASTYAPKASPSFTGTSTFSGTINNNANASSQTLTDGATISWDVSQGMVATITLGGNRTLANPTNIKIGTYILHVYQDGTGGRTLSFGSGYKWAGATSWIGANTGPGAHDIITFVCDGINMYGSWLPDIR